ncbi:hypothetical protein ABT160_04565 [Streptomyces sp. NPDC001941]|uniref:hypothetical protein n=1 Tax=Streptomyces sp. NPDC001941 TaxID=3154659 RepID=UPI00331D8D48
MAEVSYPFNSSNASGGTSVVSQTQWQTMAAMWGGDRVDFQLTSSSYTPAALPFSARVVNNRNVEINAGRAWVGGFYYQLTATQAVTIASNPTSQARKDLIVIQADLSKSALNLAVLKGTASATPVAPQPRRQPGGIWEMPLYEVDAAPLDASVSVSARMPFSMPQAISYPWNATESARYQPVGTFALDMDSNGGDSQAEYFRGRDGYVPTRHFGKSKAYTPRLLFDSNLPTTGMVYNGRWRWIAPNTVWFSLAITNHNNGLSTDNNVPYGIPLPVPANGRTGQVLTGHLMNPAGSNGFPTFTSLLGRITPGTSPRHFSVYVPSYTSLAAGLDNLRIFPGKSAITFSGVYEADTFNE